VFRPDGAHLCVRRKLASVSLRKGFFKRGCFLGGQLDHRLILTGELQEYASKGVLRFRREAAHGLDGVFKELGHAKIIVFFSTAWKVFWRGCSRDASVE
jgi:hypothetical protein